VFDEDAELGSQFRRRRDIEQRSLKCMDYDECDSSPCGEGGTCYNQHSTYICECYSGFYGDNCDDVNECLQQPCLSEQICVNTPGSFDCTCRAGYELINNRCIDIDECAQNSTICAIEEECVNYAGSFECVAINSDHKAIFRGVFTAIHQSEVSGVVNSQFRRVKHFLAAQVYNSQQVGPHQFFVEASLILSVQYSPYMEQRFLDAVDDIFASVNSYEICDYDSECPTRSSCVNGNCVCYDGFTMACLEDTCIMETYTCTDIGKAENIIVVIRFHQFVYKDDFCVQMLKNWCKNANILCKESKFLV